jgi:hypothetical protein
MQTAEIILSVLGVYTAAGLLFAAAFVIFGIARVDPTARGASLLFRLLILPGAAALWPIMARKWLQAHRPGGILP